jgi:predicted anti-sigma-YlaC factor YlaD
MTVAPTPARLADLLRRRDESLKVTPVKPSLLILAARRWRALDLSPVRRALLAVLLAAAGFTSRHALPLFGCAAFVVGAATISPTLMWITIGLALFFLEARRR